MCIPVKGKSQVGSENGLGPIENRKPNIQCTRDYPLHGIRPDVSDLLKKLSSVMKLLERLRGISHCHGTTINYCHGSPFSNRIITGSVTGTGTNYRK